MDFFYVFSDFSASFAKMIGEDQNGPFVLAPNYSMVGGYEIISNNEREITCFRLI